MVICDRRMLRVAIAILGAAAVAGHANAAGMTTDTASTSVTVANPASRPALTRDVDHPLRHFYQASAYTTACTDVGDCTLLFPAAPGSVTKIEHVSCGFILNPGGTPFHAELLIQNGTDAAQLPTTPGGTNNGETYYGISTETSLYLTTGQQPRVDAVALGQPIGTLSCTLTGRTVQ